MGKAAAYAPALHHPLAVLPVGALLALLSATPVGMCAFLAPLVALLIAPSSLLIGVGLGVGAFFALLAACITVGTLLRCVESSP